MKSAFLSLSLTALALAAEPAVGELALDNDCLTFTGELSGRVMPRSGPALPLAKERPAAIVKEPAYRGTPLYGRIRLGNGPRAETLFVVDRMPDERRAEIRVFFDRNHNGDLTDEGDGQLENVGKNLPGARIGPNFFVLPASWGEGGRETTHADFCVMFLIGADKPGGPDVAYTRAAAARIGYVDVAGRTMRVALIETACDALFDIAAAVPATRENFSQRVKHMTLLADVDGDGAFGALEVFDACLPIRIGDSTYEARASLDGAKLTFVPTTKTAQIVTPPARAAAPKDSGLLAAGTMAPDFSVERFGGGTLKLSELRGKTVVLDFWATWCIPCIRSMPHVQKTIAKAKGGEVVWLGVCVWDDRAAFNRWVPANDAKYAFTKVFDASGKDRATSIAGKLYLVSGIPTLYVIGPDGRIVSGLVGFLGDDDDRLAQALRAAGLSL